MRMWPTSNFVLSVFPAPLSPLLPVASHVWFVSHTTHAHRKTERPHTETHSTNTTHRLRHTRSKPWLDKSKGQPDDAALWELCLHKLRVYAQCHTVNVGRCGISRQLEVLARNLVLEACGPRSE